MFRATLDSTKTWKQIVDALATLLTEIHLVVSPSGITLTQYDSSPHHTPLLPVTMLAFARHLQ